MKCPNCKDKELSPVMTQQGVEVDFCPQCEGIWLDKNEIYLFTRVPTYLKAKIDAAIKSKKNSIRLSPIFSRPMAELPILEGQINIDYCPESEGFWLDKDEINMLPAIKTKLQIDKAMFEDNKPSFVKTLLPLSNLALRSAMVLFGLYALLSLFLIIFVELGKISASSALIVGIAVAALQFILGPLLMDFSLRMLYKMSWLNPEDLPQHLRIFISKICQDKGVNFPRMGIILDGSPNAFTYGHHPNNARIVITQGLLDLLSEEETEAVVAHEMGHVLHWDMLIMTLAQLVPLVLYYIYRTLIRLRIKGKDKTAPFRILIAVSAYVLYTISEFIVLWFSRLREYFADRFSGEVTGNPNALASALVKIGYGLAGDDSGKGSIKYKERQDTLNSLGPMGIFDSKTANILAVSGYSGPRSMGGEVDKEKLRGAAKWDLWNPWAAYYELQSTHPLIAKRLRFLSNQSRVLGKDPYVEFNQRRPESYWDDFLLDLSIKAFPFIAFVASITLFIVKKEAFFLWFGAFVFGSAYLIHTLFSYPDSDFPVLNIKNLLSKIKVSAIRPVPCLIRGKIIGRGVPGLIFSEDFVMQDETGIIFLDYRQPLGIFNFLFGLLRAARYINEEVEVVGWYRRAPVPYIEIKKLKIAHKESTCFVYNTKLIFSIALIILGFAKVLSIIR
ncbi:MAG: M48 family metalloprotease [Candidatus Omnitrophica bacterium]|nr:M48 family metalloprotease [Candidatus Omnitrophota bacterium]MBU1924036.1 M48 family metalloprotease [Candidatus Omnitrophota bacterium]